MRVPGRAYTLEANFDLGPTCLPVGTPFRIGAEEVDKPLQDTAAGVHKFCKIDISRP